MKDGKSNPNSYAGARSPYGSAQAGNAKENMPKKPIKKGKTPRSK